MTQPTTQKQRLDFLIRCLLDEKEEYKDIEIPDNKQEARRLLRSLMNVRPPAPAGEEFLKVQDAYLQERLAERGVTKPEDFTPVQPGIYLWQGDITTLAADAIVNAANSGMLGCFIPCHGCIDNAIHTYAGIQLRMECARIMAEQKEEESAGRAKITKAYNLPCRYVLHTVGPVIYGTVTKTDRGIAGRLLSLLFGTGGRLQLTERGILLYLHRRISFSRMNRRQRLPYRRLENGSGRIQTGSR